MSKLKTEPKAEVVCKACAIDSKPPSTPAWAFILALVLAKKFGTVHLCKHHHHMFLLQEVHPALNTQDSPYTTSSDEIEPTN